MYSLHLHCSREQADLLSTKLWEAGTTGIRELESGGGALTLIACFETNDNRHELLQNFDPFSPTWLHEEDIDWVQETQRAWLGRQVGAQIFLAPPWCNEATPPGRKRVIHNPGMACGTGDHPCTQLALEELEQVVRPVCSMEDIGAGSGILAIAARRLGAKTAIAVDVDEAALQAARENFELNALPANLVAGSADCLLSSCADLVVANINATVLLAVADELLRIVRHNGVLILTGFPAREASIVRDVFGAGDILERDGWTCLISRPS